MRARLAFVTGERTFLFVRKVVPGNTEKSSHAQQTLHCSKTFYPRATNGTLLIKIYPRVAKVLREDNKLKILYLA